MKIQKKSETFWSNRNKYFDKTLDEIDKELAEHYVRCFQDTYAEIMFLYAEIIENTANGTVLASDLYKYNKYYNLLNHLQENLLSLGSWEVKTYEKYLTELYSNYFKLTGIEINDKTFNVINLSSIREIVKKDWVGDGKDFSARIWNNKAVLAEQVKQGIVDAFVKGEGSTEVAVKIESYLKENIQQSFNGGFNVAHRLAITEMAHIQTQATLDKYQQAGLTKYQFIATNDNKTCEVDKALNGKIFRIDEAQAGVNCPPLHPNCRCAILGVID